MNDSDFTRDPFALERVGDGYLVDVPAGWAQGRGAFGGLVIGWLARAIEQTESDPSRSTRTVAAEIVGPVRVGEARIVVSPLRVGSAVSTCSARLSQGGEVLAHAVASLARARIADRDFALPLRPELPPADQVEPLPIRAPIGPEFAQHLEYRVARGLPMSAPNALLEGAANAAGYVRLVTPPARVDTAYLAAIADALWPALLVTESSPRPMATLSFTLDVVADLGRIAPDAHFAVVSRAIAGIDGYVVEERQVFAPDGSLVALNRQTFVVIQ